MSDSADETPLFQGVDEPVDAGLRLEIQSLLHFVKGRRNAGFLDPLVNEEQKIVLFVTISVETLNREFVSVRCWALYGDGEVNVVDALGKTLGKVD